MNRTNVYKTLNIALRLLIITVSLGYIYRKLAGGGNLNDLILSMQDYSSHPFFLKGMVLVILLMFLNWSVESFKWKLLVKKLAGISFFQAVQSVLTGVTISIFTPNRTGEFIGRAFILKGVDPIRPVILTIVGSLSQLLVTIIAGSLSLAFILTRILPPGTIIKAWMHAGVVSGIILLDVILLLMFFRMPLLMRLFRMPSHGRFSRFYGYLEMIGEIRRKELLQVWLLSFFRFLVFSLQFYLMLAVFGFSLPFSESLLLISVIFLALAVIPTFALTELGVRGSVSLYFIGTYYLSSNGLELTSGQSLAIVLAAGMLWVINLAIPAILGIPFVFKLKFFRK